jgi:acyl carrier protein
MTDRNEIRSKFIALLEPFVRQQTPKPIDEQTRLINDLNVNSARLVDIILETEEAFHITIDDESADRLNAVGDAVDVIVEKSAAAAPSGAPDMIRK